MVELSGRTSLAGHLETVTLRGGELKGRQAGQGYAECLAHMV